MDYRTFFNRCFCINLAREPERWNRIINEVVPGWPFAPIERVEAVDGRKCPPPLWWRAGGGAWGIYRSITAILEKCLNESVGSVLILEDDASPESNFATDAKLFLEHLPDNWAQIYLGGQHLDAVNHPPVKVNDYVFSPWNVNRCHAMGFSQSGMMRVYQHLHRKDWQQHGKDNRHQDHVDHHLGRLHVTGTFPVYCPAKWLVAQEGGESSVCGKSLARRTWNEIAVKPSRQVVAVLGCYRSGTSCVAGVIHKLGVTMGTRFFQGRYVDSPKGCFEALALYKLCMRAFPEPKFVAATSHADQVASLRRWMNGRLTQGTVLGAKHPKFCLMVPELREAFPGIKFVVVDRPLEEIQQSLRTAGWWSKSHADWLPRKMLNARNEALQSVPDDQILRLDFPWVIANPAETVEKLIAFTGVSATERQQADAIAHIDESLRRNRIEDARDLVLQQ